MDLTTAIVEGIKALAWPVATIWLVYSFRDAIVARIPDLKKFKTVGVEAEFEKAIQRVKDEVKEAAPVEVTQVIDTERPLHANFGPGLSNVKLRGNRAFVIDWKKQFQDAQQFPAIVVEDAWLLVEVEMLALALEKGGVDRTERISPAEIYDAVMAIPSLPKALKKGLPNLKALRDQVVHGRETPTPDAALDFKETAEWVATVLNQFRQSPAPGLDPSSHE